MSLRQWAQRIRRDSLTLWFAAREPATPLLPKVLCVIAVAYALSPIDLIPDFIPVLGYLDDLILLPGIIWLVLRLTPPVIVEASRGKADNWISERHAWPRSVVGALVIVGLWLVLGWVVVRHLAQ